MGNEVENVQVVIELIDKLSGDVNAMRENVDRSFSKVRDDVKKTENAFTQFSSSIKNEFVGSLKAMASQMIAVASVAALKNFIQDSIKESREWTKVQNQITEALGRTSAALADQASAMQYLTIFEDDQIANAQAMAIQFGLTEQQVLKLTPAVADLASRMGIDITTAMMRVARAMNGNGEELRRYGIQIGDVTGKNARFDAILTQIEKRAGGQAAVAHDAAGGFADLSKAIKDFQQSIGDALIDDMDALGASLATIVRSMSEFGTGMVNFVLSPFRVVISGLLGWTSSLEYLIAKVTNNKDLMALSNATMEEAQKTAKQGFEWYLPQQKKFSPSGRNSGGFVDGDMSDDLKSKRSLTDVGLQNILSYKAPVYGPEMNQAQKQEIDTRLQLQQDANDQLLAMQNEFVELSISLIPDQTQRELALLEDKHTREIEMIDQKYGQEKTLHGQAQVMKQTADDKYAIHKKLLEDQDKTRKKQIAMTDVQTANAYAQQMIGSLDTIAVASKASANVRKRLAQMSSILNTAEGVTKALTYGPILGPVLAGVVMAAGMAQLSIIESQKFALGGSFVTNGPTRIGNALTGDNPGGRELVQVTPLSSPNLNGPQGSTMVLNFHGEGNVVETFRVAVRSRDADRLIMEIRDRMNRI